MFNISLRQVIQGRESLDSSRWCADDVRYVVEDLGENICQQCKQPRAHRTSIKARPDSAWLGNTTSDMR